MMGTRYRGYLNIPKDDLTITGEVLGTGTTSKILKGYWKSRDNKSVAVKMVSTFFEREARVLDSVDHENIVSFYAAVVQVPDSYLVMELCDGGSLYDYVMDKANPLELELAKKWAIGIAKGMHYLHSEAPDKPILHRNLIAGNIVLCKKGEELVPKICSFGYAKSSQPSTFTIAKHDPSVWKGPEVLLGGKPVLKSDVYSFCMVLWHMLSRKRPFQAEEKSLTLLADIATKGKRPEIPANCPDKWKNLMTKSWSAEPEERPDFTTVLNVLEGKSDVQVDQGLKQSSHEEQTWDISSENIVCHHDDSIGGNEMYSWVTKATYSCEENLAVAAKSLNRHAGISNDNLTRYLEAVHCSKVDHENILRILGAYVDGTVFRIIMELMPTSLRKYLDENGAFENIPLKCIANGIAEGLQYLHSDQPALGLAHGGLSSNNVLLDASSIDERKWRVKLSDYCLPTLTAEGSVSHKKGYSAPEIVTSSMGIPTPKADIYSFGVVLVEMNTDQLLPPVISEPNEILQEVKQNWEALYQLVSKCVCTDDKRLTTIACVRKEMDNKLK